MGTSLLRCSSYGCRHMTEREVSIAKVGRPPLLQRRVEDLIPSGRYEDIASEVPGIETREYNSDIDLPETPD
eukprot:4656744-Alexandrium_andersonii.AAC.1